MAILMVMPADESATVGVCVLVGSEGFGEVRPVLEGVKMGLDIRVVVAHMGTAVLLGYSDVGQQLGDGLRDHG